MSLGPTGPHFVASISTALNSTAVHGHCYYHDSHVRSSIGQTIHLHARLCPLLQYRIWQRPLLYPCLERMSHQLKPPLRGLIHVRANPIQHQRQNARELFRLLKSSASLGRVEDEMMVAGEKPRNTQEAASPMEMLVWQECLDDGAEGHAFWKWVRTNGSGFGW